MSDNSELLEEEKSIFDIEALIDFFVRRKKLLVLTSSLLFSILFINTIYNYVKKPIYMGSFSILIEDPIFDKTNNNSVQEKLALNEYSYKLPTLIQYLKSELVLKPVSDKFGIGNKALRSKIDIQLEGQRPYISRGILKITLLDRNKVRNALIMDELSERYLEAASEQRKLKLNSGLNFLNSEMPIIEEKNRTIKKRIEEFRTNYNIIEPITTAQNLESQKLKVDLQISEFNSNLRRLSLIKNDIKSNEFQIDGFVEQLSDLGFSLISSDIELFNQYLSLQGELAEAKTKYKPNSKVLESIKARLASLYPEIQKKQLASIELAIKLNQSKIELEKKKLNVIGESFKLQPGILSEYEKLLSELQNSEKNFESLINAKDNFRLELAQKSLPWKIIENPTVSSQPISPNVSKETIRNLLISLLFGLSLAYLRELFDNVFHNENQIERILKPINIPLLGSLPFMESLNAENDKKEIDSSNEFLVTESLRNIATSLRFLNINNQETNIYLLTSTKQSEGKTTLTALLAKTLSDLGQNVLLIDGDMRRPSLHKFFEIDNIIGLSNLITDNKLNFKNLVKKGIYKNIDILTAGIKPPDPVFLLSSEKMKLIINEFKNDNYDVILFDAPPSNGLADAQLISEFCDLLLYVVNIEDTNKNQFLKVISKFNRNKNYALGAISNRCKMSGFVYGNYGSNYYYSENLYKYYESDTSGNNEETKSEKDITLKSKFKKFVKNIDKNSIKKQIKRFINWIDF